MDSVNKTLIHRGPDDQGIWTSPCESCIFGHTRLIVIDPKGGKQPMSRENSEKTKFTITYNGELYNAEEIRAQLIKTGHNFDVYSDTEIVLRSYIEWGSECVTHLNGIFAFAIWSKMKLFFARDRLGVKPFFYSTFPQNFIFGSEIKSLLAHPMISRDVPFENLSAMFALYFRPYGFVPFKDIQELKPGFAGTFTRSNGLKIWQYWTTSGILNKDSIKEAADKVHWLLQDASFRQTVLDVPFGTLLSGGIDSSAMTHFFYDKIKRDGKNPLELQTFSIGLPEYSKHFAPTRSREDNDEDFVRLMVSTYGTNHRCINIPSIDIVAAVEETTIAKDYPCHGDMDSSIFMFYKGIKPYATMLLTGDASDEIFGGYKDIYDDSIYPGFSNSSAANYETLLRDEMKDKFRLREKEAELYDELIRDCPQPPPETKITSEENAFRERMYTMHTYYLSAMFERKDRLSMRHGVEARVPFADHRLVEYASQLPKSYKLADGIEKFVLRKSLEKEKNFPKEIRNRVKTPYPSVVDPETTLHCRELLQKILDSTEKEPIFEWFDKEKVRAAFNARFSDLFQFYQCSEPSTCICLYSLNFWFKVNKVNVINK